jgi:FkbM family methyltransferase
MLIDCNQVNKILKEYNLNIKGILHVGAHTCEERGDYNTILNVKDENIIWVDANDILTHKNTNNGVPNCFTAALDETEHTAKFYITNNNASSSLLELKVHKEEYPGIFVVAEATVQTETLENFFKRRNLDPAKYNFWNFDIQGSELSVFRGSPELLKYVDMIYTEVNVGELYKDCGRLHEIDSFLKEHNFVRVAIQMSVNQWGDAIYIKK